MYKSAAENAIAISAINDGLEDGTYIIDDKGNLKYKDKEIKVDIKNYNFESGILVIEQGQIKDIKLIQNEKVTTGKELNKIDKWDGKAVKEVTADSNGIYHITKASELAWIAQQVNSGDTFEGKTISLDATLDLNNKEWTPIGAGETNDTYNSFNGTLEGNNNMIKNLKINKPIEASEVSEKNSDLGLFAEIKNGMARNLIIINSQVVGFNGIAVFCANISNSTINNIVVLNSTISSNKLSGLVIGYSERSNLSNLYSYNSEIQASDIYIGGVIGADMYSSLDNVYSNSNVYNNGESRLSGTGGIVGLASGSILNNSISMSKVSGYSDVGGVVGHFENGSTLKNSVSYADVSGNNMIGGVIGACSGYSGDNTLENIKSYARINGNGEFVGGIIGILSQGNNYLTNIYSKSNIKGKDKVGGIIGGFVENYETTLNYKNVISESTVEAENNKGEFLGYVDSTSIINKLD